MGQLLKELSRYTGLQERELRRIMLSAPNRYKRYTIPKRDGTRRPIAQPAREVKALQRAFTEIVIPHLPVHECATAYRKGQSILDNASPHAESGPILKMDLKNFFPSIRVRDWTNYCEKHNVLDDEERILSGQLLFSRTPGSNVLRLAIGAPSSPALSNALMFEFDAAIVAAIARDRVTFTRYADDMTFSAPRTGYLTGVQSAVAKVIRNIKSPKLEINGEKTTYITKRYHRVITGLTVSNDQDITLGRDRKRQISATIHKFSLGKLDEPALDKISGLLSFANSVEPAFVASMRSKYGDAVIDDIFANKPTRHGPPPRR